MRFPIIAILCCVVAAAFAAPASAGPAKELIQSLASAATPVLNDKDISSAERAQRTQDILRPAFDRDEMAKSLLGRYWLRATPEQQTELIVLLESYLVNAYASRVDSIEGHVAFDIQGETASGGRTMVASVVIRPQEPPVRVDWQVEDIGGTHSVTDIIVEGVSLVVSQRADFASVIRQRGGIDGLIGLLRDRVGKP